MQCAGTNISVFHNKYTANSRRQVLLVSKRRARHWSVPVFDEEFYNKFESTPHLADIYFKANNKMSSVDASFANPDTDEELGRSLSGMGLCKKKPQAINAAPESVSKDLVPRSME